MSTRLSVELHDFEGEALGTPKLVYILRPHVGDIIQLGEPLGDIAPHTTWKVRTVVLQEHRWNCDLHAFVEPCKPVAL